MNRSRTAGDDDTRGGKEFYVSYFNVRWIGDQTIDPEAVELKFNEMVELTPHGKQHENLGGLAQALFCGDIFENFRSNGSESIDHAVRWPFLIEVQNADGV